MKNLLIFTLILILSCSQAESILEKEDSESDSANSSNESMAIYRFMLVTKKSPRNNDSRESP